MNKIRLTEERYPVLRALQWDKSLILHPDWMNHGGKNGSIVRFMGIAEKKCSMQYEFAADGVAKIASDWAELQPVFSSNVEFISENFRKSVAVCLDSLWKTEIIRNLVGERLSGTLILDKFEYLYDFTLCEVTEEESGHGFRMQGTVICIIGDVVAGMLDTNRSISYTSSSFQRVVGSNECASYIFRDLMTFYLFKRYGQIQVVEALPHKKTATPGGTILVDSGVKVNHLDCTWLNTIVRSEGFKVRGHFRLQPYKENGEWAKKLIYIKEFEKHGYTRRAQRLIDMPGYDERRATI